MPLNMAPEPERRMVRRSRFAPVTGPQGREICETRWYRVNFVALDDSRAIFVFGVIARGEAPWQSPKAKQYIQGIATAV